MSKHPIITITMEDGGIMRLELLPEHAKNTVDNFLALAGRGFYDGLIFHRVISGFMIQGGCPYGTGMGGAGYHNRGEFAAKRVEKPLKHTRGVISMARAAAPDSASSQFFIMHADAPHLDGQYAAFGRLVDGFDTLDAIAQTDVNRRDQPLAEQKIKSVTAECFDYVPAEPQTL